MCLLFFTKYMACNCVFPGRVEHCIEFGQPFFRRTACSGRATGLLKLTGVELQESRLEKKEGVCHECSFRMRNEMWILLNKWDQNALQKEVEASEMEA
jgi:hypothetical protein